MQEPLTVAAFSEPLSEGERKFFSMGNILLHVVRTFISTDIVPEINFLEQNAGERTVATSVGELRAATDKLIGFCGLFGILSMIARGCDTEDVRAAMLRTTFFSEEAPEDAFGVLLEEAIQDPRNDYELECGFDVRLESLYYLDGIYPTRFFYETLLGHIVAEFRLHGLYDNRKLRLTASLEQKAIVLKVPLLDSAPKREVSAQDQLFLFHLLLGAAGMGEALFEDDGKDLIATLRFA